MTACVEGWWVKWVRLAVLLPLTAIMLFVAVMLCVFLWKYRPWKDET